MVVWWKIAECLPKYSDVIRLCGVDSALHNSPYVWMAAVVKVQKEFSTELDVSKVSVPQAMTNDVSKMRSFVQSVFSEEFDWKVAEALAKQRFTVIDQDQMDYFYFRRYEQGGPKAIDHLVWMSKNVTMGFDCPLAYFKKKEAADVIKEKQKHPISRADVVEFVSIFKRWRSSRGHMGEYEDSPERRIGSNVVSWKTFESKMVDILMRRLKNEKGAVILNPQKEKPGFESSTRHTTIVICCDRFALIACESCEF